MSDINSIRDITNMWGVYQVYLNKYFDLDEFENSLGVNCIDELTTEIKGASHRLQFILTSHHPYIINKINYQNWKIVTRKGTKIFAQDAQEFNIGKSKHEAFVQLLNLPSFKTGQKTS